MSSTATATTVDLDTLRDRFLATRRFTERLVEPLSAEDCAIQSMPDVSPTRWHLAHTTWFFETFLLSGQQGYEAFDASYAYLFNSYYNTVGEQFPRARRGLMTRPDLAEVIEYRRHVDTQMLEWFESAEVEQERFAEVIEIGIQHEQQHQELILTDIKHVLGQNPLRPVYCEGTFGSSVSETAFDWVAFDEGICSVGHEGDRFSFDNERPRHREFLEPFEIANRLVTCGEYLRFIEDSGYERPELWLSLGWDTVRRDAWTAPLYWYKDHDQWYEFTLAGPVPIDPARPVCHVSYFEADAFARWAGARLPTEAEWEVASGDVSMDGD
ncbi:MAG: ergothioneine biosynthesis protein EgtB, partial [Pirellulales bacterium]|nr:ergothioneine biosynthesis protein EgtB [Pirellulales bacterium]